MVPPSVVVAALAGMAGAWVAAGSTGLLAHPFRHALTWVALAVAVTSGWPRRDRSGRTVATTAGAVVVALLMTVTAHPVPNVMAVALVLAALAWVQEGLGKRVLLATALAVTVLAVYRLAYLSIPTVWLAADAAGRGLGSLAGELSGRPLWVGATFGGIDFLVLMAAFYAAWLAGTSRPRLRRAVCAGAAIVAVHLAYLFVLSLAAEMISALPEPPPPPEYHTYLPPDWHWSSAARTLVPWNLPLLAGVLHLLVAAAMIRWAAWPTEAETGAAAVATASPGLQITLEMGPLVLALVIPLVIVLSPSTSDLAGRKIVFYEKGRLDPPELNWKKPQHGEYGRLKAGLHGMLPELVSSLGGESAISAELSEADLKGADVLVILHPVRPWTDDQLQRIADFVSDGGSLLVAAETRIQQHTPKGELASTFNDVLEAVGAGMDVRFDSATYETDNWQHACQPIPHPATVGIGDGRNRFGIARGSSIKDKDEDDVRWPARPILVGSWGWSDPGSDAALTGLSRYDTGEKLGDLVLAAEQPLGGGTVVVLGDAAVFSNEVLPRSYPFVGRLLGHLASGGAGPQAWWRQLLGLLGCVLLVALLGWRLDPARLAGAAVLLGVSLGLCVAVSYHAGRVVPDGRNLPAPGKLAYVDASHMEAYGDAGWSLDGINGLLLTLMKNDYLPLLLPELSEERLERAGVLISIAPARGFSAGERELVKDFVEGGGIFICTAGAEDARAVGPLLDQFGFKIPHSPVGPHENDREPEPTAEAPREVGKSPELYGRFQPAYLNAKDYGAGDYQVGVWIFAGWPVRCDADNAEVLVRGYDSVPLVIARRVGSGRVVVVGDSGFALNLNMGYADGEPAQGVGDNAHFWRWMLSRMAGPVQWIPPKPEPPPEEKAGPDETPGAGPRLEPPENIFPGAPADGGAP